MTANEASKGLEVRMAVEELRQNAMMARLLDAMANGEDIGHYGRLTFVMVGQHFLTEDELVQQLTQDPDCDKGKAKSIIKQVEAHGYNPPKPGRILQWMDQQDFAMRHKRRRGRLQRI